MNRLICPISDDRINKSVVRLTGFLVAVTAVVYIVTLNPWLLVFLAFDFVIRAFAIFKFSPLSLLACGIAIGLKRKPTLIDKAPKLFAARVGFLFSLVGIILYFISPVASIFVLSVLTVFAMLESLFDFCVGCVVYTYVILPMNNLNV